MTSLRGKLVRLAYSNQKVRNAVLAVLMDDPESGLDPTSQAMVGDLEINKKYMKNQGKALPLILNWAGLSGQTPQFLGRGTRGSAYRFGAKVLKLTGDDTEATSASQLIGKEHPNVYRVYKVARVIPCECYAILYEYLEEPTRDMKFIVDQWETNKTDLESIVRNWTEKQALQGILRLAAGPSIAENKTPTLYQKLTLHIAGAMNLSLTELELKTHNIPWHDYIAGTPLLARKLMKQMGTYNQYLQYFHDVAQGLLHLKNLGISFRDLHDENVMQRNGTIVLIDPGYSQVHGSFAGDTLPQGKNAAMSIPVLDEDTFWPEETHRWLFQVADRLEKKLPGRVTLTDTSDTKTETAQVTLAFGSSKLVLTLPGTTGTEVKIKADLDGTVRVWPWHRLYGLGYRNTADRVLWGFLQESELIG